MSVVVDPDNRSNQVQEKVMRDTSSINAKTSIAPASLMPASVKDARPGFIQCDQKGKEISLQQYQITETEVESNLERNLERTKENGNKETSEASETSDESFVNLEVTPDQHATNEAIQQKNELLQQYACFENLGHTLAYDLAKITDLTPANPKTILVLEHDGSYGKYTVYKLEVNEKDKDALVPFLMIPEDAKPGSARDIKLTFRGTASKTSAECDLFEPQGAGSVTFAANEEKLLKQVSDHLIKYNQEKNPNNEPLHLTIAGHSLGGAFTQLMTASSMEAQAQNLGLTPGTSVDQKDPKKTIPKAPLPKECREGFQLLSNLRMTTQSSAGIPQHIYERNKLVAGYLAEKRKKGNSKLTVEANIIHVAGDPVQKTGQATLLSNLPKEHAKVSLLKFLNEWEYKQVFNAWTALAAITLGGTPGLAAVGVSAVVGAIGGFINHRKKAFSTNTARCQHFTNETEEGKAAIHQLLSNKTKSLDVFQQGCLALGEKLGDFASSIGSLGSYFSSAVSQVSSVITQAQATEAEKIQKEIPPLLLSGGPTNKQALQALSSSKASITTNITNSNNTSKATTATSNSWLSSLRSYF